MDYIRFRELFIDGVAFTTRQAKIVAPDLNLTNLYRWTDKGYLVKLRNGCYAFRECTRNGAYNYFFSQFIYRPSYISLETALSFYGLIPEAVVSMTAVTTLGTKTFINDTGQYSYRTISRQHFWGYSKHLMSNGRQSYYLADMEKAILDFLYLNTFYNTIEDITDLRFDDYIMSEVLNREKLLSYTKRFDVSALSDRVELLLSLYD
ncbi:type IV toxin-antitoxin system AbiEi family antitoxin domain-containing protein [Porphyromonas levii]|uniref:type IV toxin-antitoxin system AbiEi family antitoxin domain-containing protein n=1 Tax=Porphyromonas levii TaxID=28114 RepID=UPI00036FCC49|nr:hypothetical protein [Porphyromonas levii]MBR8758998.1 hypothetical protein [Porphyromonas levii]MBR8766040.1 hypothetical protein [Porphyromonas levii]MBR8773562.1 hypothetical protein [Porphyromonas levii]MBR8801757.1 hypothetical protein [Porphyromonas levii]